MKKTTQNETREDTARAFCLYEELVAERRKPTAKSGWSARYAESDDGLVIDTPEEDDFFAVPKPRRKGKAQQKPAAERAKRAAVNMLNYASCSKARLAEKLARKGFAKADADAAIAHVQTIGLLNEARDVAHAVEYLANARLYGRRKIVESLYAKGYRREEIEGADWASLDFAANCARYLARHMPAEAVEGSGDDADTACEGARAAREKRIAAARRRGFSMREIMTALAAEEEET